MLSICQSPFSIINPNIELKKLVVWIDVSPVPNSGLFSGEPAGLLLGRTRSPHFKIPIPSMGLVYFPTWMVDFYGFHVGKYTNRPMDASWDRWFRYGPGKTGRNLRLLSKPEASTWMLICKLGSKVRISGL